MQYLECPDLGENKSVDFYATINGKMFRFAFNWNEYCGCCFLDIYDSKGVSVSTGNALCCNTVIRTDKRILPHLYIRHKDGLNLEPEISTIKDYRIYYEDTSQ